jgi:hypothetical protein
MVPAQGQCMCSFQDHDCHVTARLTYETLQWHSLALPLQMQLWRFLCRLPPRHCSWLHSGLLAVSRPTVPCFKSALDFYVGVVRCTCVQPFLNRCFILHGCLATCSICLPPRGDVAMTWVPADTPHVELFACAARTKMCVGTRLPHVELSASASASVSKYGSADVSC